MSMGSNNKNKVAMDDKRMAGAREVPIISQVVYH